ncbi:thiamine diphosphokinase [Clostridium sp.]|uniref:thiamine diphosphokinase n=1 Tax=Clostridium sp. TaxID=1506 RepID=UPI002FCAAC97
MRALVIGGGDAPSKELILSYLVQDTIIIAADSGANILYSYNIKPNYLLGDFDSINSHVLKEMQDTCGVVRFPIEKDYTDSDLALDKAIEVGASEVIFLGCTGKRIDHFLGNICVLYRALKSKVKAYIVDDYNVLYLTDKSVLLQGTKGETFSILSYFKDVKGLTITGAKYPLSNYDLNVENSLTISNQFNDEKVNIDFKSGVLLVMLCKDKV